MRIKRVVLSAGLIAGVAAAQLIANAAAGQPAPDEPESTPRVSVVVEIAPSASPAPPAKVVNKDAPRRDGPRLEMSVVDVGERDCPQEEGGKTRLGLMENSAVSSLCD